MIFRILGVRIDPTSYESAAAQIHSWVKAGESRYVCTANVHMLMEAYDSPRFRNIVNSADLVTPDGMPLVWMLRLKGNPYQKRVYGPTLMLEILEAAAREKIPVGLFGSSTEVIQLLTAKLRDRFPNLEISYSLSLPFRKITDGEDVQIISQINASSTRILFVALGCPKQETWMADHRGKINSVMLGVGAAFDFHAGVLPQAPLWMQRIGLEWLFRFLVEPGRLWTRYLYHNPRFIILAIADLLGFIKS